MALTWKIVKFIANSADGVLEHDLDNVIGQIRLWDSDTNTPTDKFIVVVEDILNKDKNKGNNIKANDWSEMDIKINEILTRSQANLNDFNIVKRHNFHMDIKISGSIINQYTG